MSVMPAGLGGSSFVPGPDDATDAADASAPASPSASALPPLAPGAYDAAATSTAAIAALEKDPATRALGFTIDNARVNYASIAAAGGRVVVSTSAANGGKPVVTLVAPGFDPSQPARVHTHYHGFNATVADPLGHGSGTTARIEEIEAADPQTVFVLPECANAPAIPSRLDGKLNYATSWSNVSDVGATTDDALAAAGVDPATISERVVSAHSGGGAALASAIDKHPDGSGLRCDRLELLDCLYGSEKEIAAWGKTSNGAACGKVAYFHGTNDHPDAGLKKAFGDRWGRTDVAQPKAADDPALKDASGNPVRDAKGRAVQRYSADPHNRTNAMFMDAGGG
jgi:hypothetical protein